MSGSTRAWLEVQVQVAQQHTDQIESLLASQGALSITLSDIADTPILEPGVGETPLWPDVQVTGLFDGEVDRDKLKAVISLAPGVDSDDQISFVQLHDRDWERAWMEGFKPMKFGENLWIIPGDHEAPEPDALLMRLDPGLAFGSGTHQTTRLCLEWIDGLDLEGASVLDFGCGSGVLGLAAALKNASSVLCVDNDPQALVATVENAERNKVSEKITVLDAGGFSITGASFDVIVANILAGTLVALAPGLCSSLKPGGRIAISGILQEQAQEVSETYARWLENISVSTLDEWVLISGTLRKQAS